MIYTKKQFINIFIGYKYTRKIRTLDFYTIYTIQYLCQDTKIISKNV